MKTIRLLATACSMAALALVGIAQAQPGAATAPAQGASMPQDCPKPTARHDHAAEKGMPTSKTGCAPTVAKSPRKDKTRHYHPRDAKNQ